MTSKSQNRRRCLADLTDHDRLEALFRETRPEIIFHAAAYKHVPLMESHCGEAVKNIVLATRNLVDLADDHGAKTLVMISTDKAVNPTSVMGSCKRLAEQYVQARSAGSVAAVPIRHGAVRQRARFVGQRGADFSRADCPRRTGDGDAPGDYALLHADSRGGAARDSGRRDGAGRRNLRARHGRAGPHSRPGPRHDSPLRDCAWARTSKCKSSACARAKSSTKSCTTPAKRTSETAHPKIMVAASARRHVLEVIRDIGRLEALVNEPNDMLKAALREIIPIQPASDAVPLPQGRVIVLVAVFEASPEL